MVGLKKIFNGLAPIFNAVSGFFSSVRSWFIRKSQILEYLFDYFLLITCLFLTGMFINLNDKNTTKVIFTMISVMIIFFSLFYLYNKIYNLKRKLANCKLCCKANFGLISSIVGLFENLESQTSEYEKLQIRREALLEIWESLPSKDSETAKNIDELISLCEDRMMEIFYGVEDEEQGVDIRSEILTIFELEKEEGNEAEIEKIKQSIPLPPEILEGILDEARETLSEGGKINSFVIKKMK